MKKENKGGIGIFVYIKFSNENSIDPFFTRRRHKRLDVEYLSQWTFD